MTDVGVVSTTMAFKSLKIFDSVCMAGNVTVASYESQVTVSDE
jgi:hypothetical protein